MSSYSRSADESYELTSEPILDQRFRNLPLAIQNEFNQLSETAETNGAAAIPRLLELLEKYPLPLIYSCLAIAYGRVDAEKQKQIIRENYQKNPKNLFARCNYARLCLAEDNLAEIPLIFDQKFELKTLYPKRNQFHVTEYTALTSVFCEYYFKSGNSEQAEALYTRLKEAMPDSAETLLMQELLHPTFWQKVQQKYFA
ncbi:MAG: hypothetical protein GQ582_03460 [Methyloprofundus sp.]|nr:hypothetical protein [Methyloprofundus sp.]